MSEVDLPMKGKMMDSTRNDTKYTSTSLLLLLSSLLKSEARLSLTAWSRTRFSQLRLSRFSLELLLRVP
jgi:hypothetical protein